MIMWYLLIGILVVLTAFVAYCSFIKPLWEQDWFCNMVMWLNEHWAWWNKYIWGNSISVEDFVRNPAEVLRDNCFPFVIKNVKPYSLFNLRLGYKYFQTEKVQDYLDDGTKHGYTLEPTTYWSVPLGDKRILNWKIKNWSIFDLRIWNKFWTKYVNAVMFFQIIISMKWFIPIPYFVFCFRPIKEWYFQFGFGYSPQLQKDSLEKYDTVLTAKFRMADHKSESVWNPSDVYGWWEGSI
jgi:hypothetical protein